MVAKRAATATLKAPFPWFGGKSKVAPIVWSRLGDVPAYVEPFFGSGACLLARPEGHTGYTETVNDLDGYVANFWRATAADPEAVARYCDWPVNEADLHARHRWLVDQVEFRQRVRTEPDWYDAKIAGWWCWGLCCWIGSGWCDRGRSSLSQKLPNLGNDGQGVHRKTIDSLSSYFLALADRLRRVRVCCGDWSRVLTPSACGLHHNPVVGVFLDPPYADTAGRAARIYAEDSLSVAHEVRAWAIEHGNDPRYRICLCGYEGEHAMPDDWECVAWKAHGGMGNQGNGAGKANRHRERLWFSPHCLRPDAQPALTPARQTSILGD